MLAPAAPLLLLRPALLLLLLLRGGLPGPGSHAAEKPPRQVNGRLGGSAGFPLDLPPAETVDRIEWSFQTGSAPKTLIAELRDGKLERKKASDRLGQRLEMAGNTTLRIRALEKEDSGVLAARVVFASLEIHEQTFRLSVFDPVPDPQIHPQLTSKTAEGCNLTLQCLASREGLFNISWKQGDQLSALEGGLGWYQLSPEGTELHLSWRPNSSDSTITCLFSNPVDQKNVSFDLFSVCLSEGHPWTAWLLVLLVLILAAGLGTIYLWMKRWSQGALPLAAPEKDGSPPESQYAELRKRRSPPEGNENQDPEPFAPCLAEIPTVTTPATVYAMLQPPSTT